MNNKPWLIAGIALLALAGIAATQFVRQPRETKRGRLEARQRWRAEHEIVWQQKKVALKLARQYKASGDVQVAASWFRDALKTKTDSSEICREMGDMFLEYGLLQEAEDAYFIGATGEQHKQYRLGHVVQFRLAAFYAQTGRPELAFRWVQTAMYRRPGTRTSRFQQANLPPHVISKLPNFRPVAGDMPRIRAFAHAQIAKEFAFHAETEAFALSEYKKSVQLDPDSLWQAETWAMAGHLAIEQHDGDTATVAYKKGLQLARKTGNTEVAERCEDGLKRIESIAYWNKLHPEKPYRLTQTPESDTAKPQPK